MAMKIEDITQTIVQDAADKRDDLTVGAYNNLRGDIRRYVQIDDPIEAFIIGMFVGSILEEKT